MTSHSFHNISTLKPDFSCDQEPGVSETSCGIQYITADTQLRITKKGTNDTEIWAPFLFRSCMDPILKEIRTLTIHVFSDKLELTTPYSHACYNQNEIELEILPWSPSPQQKGCIPCRNCGNCGW